MTIGATDPCLKGSSLASLPNRGFSQLWKRPAVMSQVSWEVHSQQGHTTEYVNMTAYYIPSHNSPCFLATSGELPSSVMMLEKVMTNFL
jgi:hypothetical protein